MKNMDIVFDLLLLTWIIAIERSYLKSQGSQWINVFDILIASVSYLCGLRKKCQRLLIMTKLSLARILGGSRTLTLVEFWWEPHDRGTCTRDGPALIQQQREPGWGQARAFRVSFSEELPRTPTMTVFRWCAVMTQWLSQPQTLAPFWPSRVQL